MTLPTRVAREAGAMLPAIGLSRDKLTGFDVDDEGPDAMDVVDCS